MRWKVMISDYKWYTVGACITGYVVYKLIRKPRNLPPGPLSLPIIGGMYSLPEEKDFFKSLEILSKKYGDVFSIDMGPRYDFEDPELHHLIFLTNEFFGKYYGFVDANLPFIDLLPQWLFRVIFRSKVKDACYATDAVLNFLMEKVKKHRDNLNKRNPKDAVDVYISEREEEGFDDEVLASTILVLSGDATDTTAIVLKWYLLYMILYPDVQAKIQEEIDVICGVSTPVQLADKSKMPYFEATFTEVFRHSNVSPSPAYRSASKDTTLGGYNIPRGTPILFSFYCVNHDPRVWKDPKEFRPDRHLDNRGQFNRVSLDIVTPFGSGRRACMGEQLARSVIFLMMTNILQKFTLAVPKNQPKPSLSNLKEDTLLPCPAEYELQATPR